ncbi:GNAT family N-acetyltransferase [Kitasatospora sp. NPDC096147]|uniref:GNAT family N-acetyltransferase n=1 Tax=Kitasatospora sp. NPDC096147 TaxID=3364093 RepID=UPI00382DC49B
MIRPAAPADVPTVHAMIVELAAYERVAHLVELTEDELRTALFGERPTARAHLAVGPDGEPVGFALWYLSFSTWQGTGIHLEDLYVRPAARGGGYGRALLRELAVICAERGYRRLEWWVLDWNEPAIAFYKALGAVALDELSVYRLGGAPLAELAAG